MSVVEVEPHPADIVVADMSGRSPNVFYEVGYAHALGRRVVLLTKSADDIPFDLRHHPHIVYKGRLTELKSSLRARLEAILALGQTASLAPLVVHSDGRTLQQDIPCTIVTEWRNIGTFLHEEFALSLHFDLFNPFSQVFRGSSAVALVLPPEFGIPHSEQRVVMRCPDGERGRCVVRCVNFWSAPCRRISAWTMT